MKYLGKKIKISVDNLKGHQKEFVKKTKLIAQQRFKSERHKVFFTKVINMIALSSKEHIKKQSKLARNSWSSVSNIINLRLWLWKNNYITKSNK